MKNLITLTLSLFICLSSISQNTLFSEEFEVPIDETDWTTGMSTSIQEAPFDYPGDLDPWEMWDITTQSPYVHSGNSAAFIGGTLTLEDKYDWLISPEFSVPTDATTNVNYWMWYYSSNPSYWTWLYIMVYDVGEDTWELGELIFYEDSTSLYYEEEYSFDVSPWEGKDVKVAFVKRGTYQFAMDDISCISIDNGNDLALTEIQTSTNQDGCSLTADEEVKITLENTGTTDISTFDVKYSINNGPYVTETVSEQINTGETLDYTFIEKADLSAYGDYTIDIEVIVENDQNSSNNSLTTNIKSKDAYIDIELMTDFFPADNSWIIVDENNTVIARNGELTRETLHYDTVCLMSTGCYTFTLIDTFGDGISGDGHPPGYLNVYYNGFLIGGFNENESNFGYEFSIDSIGDGCDIVGVNSVSQEMAKAYPNPVSDLLFLENLGEEHSIRIFDMLGREFSPKVNSGVNDATIDFSLLPTGVYLVKITSQSDNQDSFLIQKR